MDRLCAVVEKDTSHDAAITSSQGIVPLGPAEYLKMHSESTKLVEGTKNSFNVTLGLGCVRDPKMHSESTQWVDENFLVLPPS